MSTIIPTYNHISSQQDSILDNIAQKQHEDKKDFLTSIYKKISSDEGVNESPDLIKGTFYGVLNYLVANDEQTTQGVKRKDIEDRFSLRKDFNNILSMLAENNVIETTEQNCKLLPQAKQFISPLLENVLKYSYQNKFNNKENFNDECLENPHIKILLDCRSQLYSS